MLNNIKDMKELSKRIYDFIEKYAIISPNWDGGSTGKYTAPDVYQMIYAAEMLSEDILPTRCWSDWSGGGYKKINANEGRVEHDYLVSEIYKLINKK